MNVAKKQADERYKKLIQSTDYRKKEKFRAREKYHRLYKSKVSVDKVKKRRIMSSYKSRYPEKISAHIKAQRIGPLYKGNHMHHWSYNDIHKKDVIELSMKNHYAAHCYLVYDQSKKMYRTENGELLDSKEKHYTYILACIRKHRQNPFHKKPIK